MSPLADEKKNVFKIQILDRISNTTKEVEAGFFSILIPEKVPVDLL